MNHRETRTTEVVFVNQSKACEHLVTLCRLTGKGEKYVEYYTLDHVVLRTMRKQTKAMLCRGVTNERR